MINIGSKLKKERELLNMSKSSVAKKMGFNHYQTISEIESGKREVKAWEIVKLAGIYGRKVDFFLKPEVAQCSQKVLWRNRQTQEQTVMDERRFLVFCENYARLLKLNDKTISSFNIKFSIEKSNFSNRAFRYVEDIAGEISRFYNLGSRPACVLPKLLEDQGILLLYLDLGESGPGASSDGNFGKAILVNSSDAPWRQNYDIAHELFHILTWDIFTDEEIYADDNTSKSAVEKWADAFASVMLLPEEAVKLEFNRKATGDKIEYLSLIEMARDFQVSLPALLWRLVNLGILEKDNVEKALADGAIADIDKKARFNDWHYEVPYLSNRYIELAIRAYDKGKLSKRKLADYLDKPLGDIAAFLANYGYDEEQDYSHELIAP